MILFSFVVIVKDPETAFSSVVVNVSNANNLHVMARARCVESVSC